VLIGFQDRRGVKRDATASGKRRNESWEPMSPTAGRVLLGQFVVAHLRRCWASPCKARLALAQNHPGQMVQFGPEML
jgi:hypothetical protein